MAIYEFPLYLVCGLAIAIYILFCIVKKRKIYEKVWNIIFVIYIINVINIVFFPLPIIENPKSGLIESYVMENNYIPFKMLKECMMRRDPLSFSHLIKNVIMTMPLGFLIPAIWKNKSNKIYITIACLVPIVIELLQFLLNKATGINYRSVDIDDIILNICGYVVGWIVYIIFNKIYRYISKNKATE